MDVKQKKERESELSDHLYGFRDDSWALWRWIDLRGAGFAARTVLNLAAPDTAAAADRFSHLEVATAQAKKAAIETFRLLLKQVDPESRRPIHKVLSSLKKNKIPNLESAEWASDSIREIVDRFEQVKRDLATAKADYPVCYQEGEARVSERIRSIARMGRFREAIIWQNRRVLDTAVNHLLKESQKAGRNSSKYRCEILVANYLQRYCTKNDTIGFFGPVGWAKIAPETEAMLTIRGDRFLAERNIYFEGWCIDRLCEAISEGRKLQRWIAPRRVCFIHQEGEVLHMPSRPSVKLSRGVARVLEACNGTTTAGEICKQIVEDESVAISQEEEVYKLLEGLEKKGLIVWNLEATQDVYLERGLRKVLEKIEEQGEREKALEVLDEMEEARRRVGEAGGNAEKLEEAIRKMEETFTRITGEAATRGEGQTYAARTLIYEDCRRETEVEIGEKVIKELEGAMSLLLRSARWYIDRLGEDYEKELKEVYRRLVRRRGSKVVDFMTYWYIVRPMFFTQPNERVKRVTEEFQSKWGRVLRYEGEEGEVKRREEELREEVREEFKTEGKKTSISRYHSPDVMIAARDEEAIRRGEYKIVMGELHMGINTMDVAVPVYQHPAPEELFSAMMLDFPSPRVVTVVPKSHRFGHVLRLLPVLYRPQDIYLKVAPDPPNGSQVDAIPLGELVIEEKGEDLLARTRDGRTEFRLLEAFSNILSALIGRSFEIVPPRRHTPRITVDNVVLCRESWSLPASELSFAFNKDRFERYREARIWARSLHLPRFVFVRSKFEAKPFYLDFESPIYVDIFAKSIRRYEESGQKEELISLSEMLPTIEQSWLCDYDGDHYTSELRMICVDRECV